MWTSRCYRLFFNNLQRHHAASQTMKLLPIALLCSLVFAGAADAQTPGSHPRDARAPSTKTAPKLGECGALPANLEGMAFALDGNTLVMAGQKAPIVIWGIQAPELRDKDKSETVPGMRARAALEALLEKADRKVKCRPFKWDSECQPIAQCATADSVDIGGYMLSSGMAYGWHLDEALPWETRASQRYGTAESLARDKKVGLWPLWLGEK
jgi:endonuclease YncB( thermonuclease family)